MTIEALAIAQLDAYNRADLDAFCACYHPEVRVLHGDAEQLVGIEAFRQRYADLFARGGFGATVPERLRSGSHCVDLEHWWRDGDDGRIEGEVLVRYTAREDRIGVVQFLR